METREFAESMGATMEGVERKVPLPKQKRTSRGKEKNFITVYIEKRGVKGNVAQEVVLSLAFLMLAFLFSKTALLFGALPLGIGLLCARKNRLPETALGMAIGLVSVGMMGIVYGIASVLALGLRAVCSMPGKGRKILPDSVGFYQEMPELRVAVAAVTGLLLGGYQLLAGGITTASLLFGISMVLLTPVSCVAFIMAFENCPPVEAVIGLAPLPEQKRAEAVLWRLGSLALITAVCYTLKGVELFGISISLSVGVACALFAGKRFGGVSGMVAGLLCGGVILPVYAPALGLAGLLSGVLWPLGGFFALGLGVAAGTVWSAFIGGLTGFLTVFPELTIMSVLLLPALKRVKKDCEFEKTDEEATVSETVRVKADPQETDEKMLKLSGTLSSLTKLYKTYRSALTAPKMEASVVSARELCQNRCRGCAHRDSCWAEQENDNQSLMDGFLTLAVDKLYRGELTDQALLPESIKNACAVPDAILEDVRTAVGQSIRLENEQEQQPYPALEYDIAAAMMRDVVRYERGQKREMPKLTEQVKTVLHGYGIYAKNVSVQGQKYKTVTVTGASRRPSDTALVQLQKALEEVCGGKFAPISVTSDRQGWRLFTHSVKKYATETAVVMRSASPEEVSGDTVRFYDMEEGRFCAVLSDGMGCGATASAVSGLCVSFLEKLMEAGCHRSTAVKLLNQTIRTGSEGNGTTLDLAEIDLLHGDATFLKAGAAASYVKRGTQLFRIRSKTIPLGLLKTPDTEKTRFHLEEGDVVIMLSDGISQMPEESPALCSLLAADWGEQSLQESAGRILTAAMNVGERADDMTVSLVRIKAA